MARRFPLLLVLTAFFGCCTLSVALPPTPAATMRGDKAVHISLGQSAAPLNGPWKFTVGDSPLDSVTHAPLWAEPGFDDSKWETVDMTPETGATDPESGLQGYVPGWAAKGHAGYWGYAWYRIRVHLEAQPREELALAGPSDVDDVYQVFDNGRLVGHFGDFTGSRPLVYYTRPMMFPLPQSENQDSGSSTLVLAFRVWMEPYTLTGSPEAGGLHTAPVLGEAGAVTADYQIRWLELVRAYALNVFEALSLGLLAVVAFSLILFDRSDKVYLWMGAVFLLQASSNALTAFTAWTQHLSLFADILIGDGIQTPLIYAGWVMVWWVWFGRQGPAWIPRATAALTLVFMVSNTIGEELFFALVPHPVAVEFHMVSMVVRLLFFVLLAWIVIEGIRRQGREGWLVLPVVVLRGIGAFRAELSFLHIQLAWHPLGLTTTPGEIANLLLGAVIALLLLRRLLLTVRRQRQMALDVKQAQEVQQVILPQPRTTLPGLVIESEYRPVLEVGGDFFQIIPHKTDGSLLIVAGDVAGKGLKAGMLVALLVGATRTAARFNPDPANMLNELNQRLLGRGNAHATCLALSIAKDGAATLANAGHMPPYLNGDPLEMEGSLPLGMIAGAEFSVMRFQLKEDDRLILMSDGVAEATDSEGRLFGFERVHELLRTARSAAEVAAAAQCFGQEDDISVISVTRTAVLEPALA
jgi:sulfur transfer complex TusBCD TusB component (DsrH family)